MNKKTSEIRELIWDRAKILEKKKNYSLVEQLQLCVFNWTRAERVAKIKKLPEGRKSGLFYLTVPGTVTEDNIWVYRGKVTEQKKLPEIREPIWARAKILVKKMKLLVFIEHGVVSLFSYGFLTPLASWFLLDKTFIN